MVISLQSFCLHTRSCVPGKLEMNLRLSALVQACMHTCGALYLGVMYSKDM